MIIPWFPWLERLSIAAGVSGFALLGFVNYGAPGLALGALAGMFIGRWGVNLPLVFWASQRVHRLVSLSNEELRALFVPNPRFGRAGELQTAMIVMKNRGADVRPLLPIILDMMGSPKLKLRLNAWAAFHAGFPDLCERLGDYDPHEAALLCQAKLASVRSAVVAAAK
jgi:hypothetical protein